MVPTGTKTIVQMLFTILASAALQRNVFFLILRLHECQIWFSKLASMLYKLLCFVTVEWIIVSILKTKSEPDSKL